MNTIKSIGPFKSERAAKMAYTKQLKVWEVARATLNALRHEGAMTRLDRARALTTPEEKVLLTKFQAEFQALPQSERYESEPWLSFIGLENAIHRRPLEAAEAHEAQAEALLRAIYDMAKSQGFWIKSYEYGCNPTRDLIRANMD